MPAVPGLQPRGASVAFMCEGRGIAQANEGNWGAGPQKRMGPRCRDRRGPKQSHSTRVVRSRSHTRLCKRRAKSGKARFRSRSRRRLAFCSASRAPRWPAGCLIVRTPGSLTNLQADPELERRAAADGRGQRALIEIIELAADRHAVRQPRDFDLGVMEEVGDVMGGALAVDRGVQREDDLVH
jgi:hypothetical protein